MNQNVTGSDSQKTNQAAEVEYLVYEYPFIEKIRTFLRLESIFDKLHFFLQQQHCYEHHVVLLLLFEILEVIKRGDLKSDLLQELEKQKNILSLYLNDENIAQETLAKILADIQNAMRVLGSRSESMNQMLKQHEWLMSIRSRASIPGGLCEFDAPTYFAWQKQPFDKRVQDLLKWLEPLLPLRYSLKILLGVLRQKSEISEEQADKGQFQKIFGSKSYHLMQVHVPKHLNVIPMMSANKYMVNIRFSTQDEDFKLSTTQEKVPFKLHLCRLY